MDRALDSMEVHVVGIDRGVRRKNDSKFQRDVIEAKISELRVRVVEQQDTVFCYVMTHGAFDGRHSSPDEEYGHWFQTEKWGEVYPRIELMKSLLSLNSRLTVLISDTCNVRIDAFEPLVPEKSLLTKEYGALRSLLLEHRGQVDISASSQGQFSFYGNAGVFTTAFLGLAQTYRSDTTWQEFYSVLQAATQAEFERTFPGGCTFAWDETTRTVLSVLPTDPRAQKELRPFAMRPITWVVHESQHNVVHP